MKIVISYLCALVFTALGASPSLQGSPSTDEEEPSEPQVVSGLLLPFWEEGECRENFEIRIWPSSVVVWLEEENLRSLIADPATSEVERRSLKRVLALQRAWRVHS